MMLYHFVSIFILLAGRAHGLTQYVADNVTITVESVQPCHLFGDSDLFGRGVRASFYISWVTGVIGVLLGATGESKSPRLSFNILLCTLLIILIRNANRGSFATLEWYIVTGLAFLSFGVLFVFVPRDFVSLEEKDDDDAASESTKSGAEGSGDERESGPSQHSNNQPPDGSDGTQDISKSKREIKEENRMKEALERVHKLRRAGYYSDPIGLGFLILIYGALFCCLPWLHFTKAESGHKAGCAVPIVLFGTWDMYNSHWQGFLKFGAVSGVLAGTGFIVLGSRMITRGVKKWEMYELTLRLMKERRNAGIKLWRLDLRKIKDSLRETHPDNLVSGNVQGATGGTTLRRTEGIHRLEELVQLAESQEQRAAMTESQARDLMKRVSDRVDGQQRGRKRSRILRVSIFLAYSVSGALAIWFIERTITENHIDMDDDLGSSSGQLLALLVALLTTSSFVWELFKSWRERRKAIAEAEEIANYITIAALDVHVQATRQKAALKRLKESFSREREYLWSLLPQSFLRPSAPAPSTAPTTQPTPTMSWSRFGSPFSSLFSSPRRGRGGDSAV